MTKKNGYIKRIGVEEKKAIVAMEGMGYSPAEMAEELGVSKKKVYAARHQMRKDGVLAPVRQANAVKKEVVLDDLKMAASPVYVETRGEEFMPPNTVSLLDVDKSDLILAIGLVNMIILVAILFTIGMGI